MAKKTTSRSEVSEGLISHLIELRNRLIRAVLAVLLVFFALMPFADRLYVILAQPLVAALPVGTSMIATDLISPFLTPLKLAFAASIVVAVPYLLYQFWAFVAPGLYRNEKRTIAPFLISSTLLFYTGMAFAYFLVFPTAFFFLSHTAPEGVAVMTDMRAYMDLVFALFFAFGIAFEVPVATVLFVKLGVVKPQTLSEKRAYVVLAAFTIAAFLTPPDVLSQFMLAVPMWILFEIGLRVAYWVAPLEQAVGEGHRDMTEEEMEAELNAYEREHPNDKR